MHRAGCGLRPWRAGLPRPRARRRHRAPALRPAGAQLDVTAYDDGSVDVSTDADEANGGLKYRWQFGPPAAGLTWVGGTVLYDYDWTGAQDQRVDQSRVLLVRSDGQLVWHELSSQNFSGPAGQVGGAAVAAVPRSYTTFGGFDAADPAPGRAFRNSDVTEQRPARNQALMMVLRADGQLVPIRIGDYGDPAVDVDVLGFQQGPAMSTLPNGGTLAGQVTVDRPLLDFDYSCTTASRVLADQNLRDGSVAAWLGCPAAGAANTDPGGADPVTVGRMSVGIGTDFSGIPAVEVVTASDYVDEAQSGFWSLASDRRNEGACVLADSDGAGIHEVAPASFDVRTPMGATVVACVENVPAAAPTGRADVVHTYLQPETASPLQHGSANSSGLDRSFERVQQT